MDTVTYLTGARINFQTLRIDQGIGDGFILQRISTGETIEVRLKPGVFPKAQADLEKKIEQMRAQGKAVPKEDIDAFEAMADALSKKLLNTPPEELISLTPLPDYRFRFNDLYGGRRDIINKDMKH